MYALHSPKNTRKGSDPRWGPRQGGGSRTHTHTHVDTHTHTHIPQTQRRGCRWSFLAVREFRKFRNVRETALRAPPKATASINIVGGGGLADFSENSGTLARSPIYENHNCPKCPSEGNMEQHTADALVAIVVVLVVLALIVSGTRVAIRCRRRHGCRIEPLEESSGSTR